MQSSRRDGDQQASKHQHGFYSHPEVTSERRGSAWVRSWSCRFAYLAPQDVGQRGALLGLRWGGYLKTICWSNRSAGGRWVFRNADRRFFFCLLPHKQSRPFSQRPATFPYRSDTKSLQTVWWAVFVRAWKPVARVHLSVYLQQRVCQSPLLLLLQTG